MDSIELDSLWKDFDECTSEPDTPNTPENPNTPNTPENPNTIHEKTKNCKNCDGSSENFVTHLSDGDVICPNCGIVQESHYITDDPEWNNYSIQGE